MVFIFPTPSQPRSLLRQPCFAPSFLNVSILNARYVHGLQRLHFNWRQDIYVVARRMSTSSSGGFNFACLPGVHTSSSKLIFVQNASQPQRTLLFSSCSPIRYPLLLFQRWLGTCQNGKKNKAQPQVIIFHVTYTLYGQDKYHWPVCIKYRKKSVRLDRLA